MDSSKEETSSLEVETTMPHWKRSTLIPRSHNKLGKCQRFRTIYSRPARRSRTKVDINVKDINVKERKFIQGLQDIAIRDPCLYKLSVVDKGLKRLYARCEERWRPWRRMEWKIERKHQREKGTIGTHVSFPSEGVGPLWSNRMDRDRWSKL